MDDGFFEVVGFRDAWHGLVLFTPNGHGTRLAQVSIKSPPSVGHYDLETPYLLEMKFVYKYMDTHSD